MPTRGFFTFHALFVRLRTLYRKSMSRYFLTILMCFVVAVIPMAAERAASSHAKNSSVASVQEDGDLTYASISKTNPFEIVPAAGMEVLDDIDNSEAAIMAADMIEFAKKYLGTRYVRGGKSPKRGFDCSGFTSYVFSQFGYSLGASSGDQYSTGTEISRDEVSKGDLLFFTGRNSRNRRVGHVGIAIDNNPVTGEITFIHAAISGGIRIDRISAPYYAARFIGARRVL